VRHRKRERGDTKREIKLYDTAYLKQEIAKYSTENERERGTN